MCQDGHDDHLCGHVVVFSLNKIVTEKVMTVVKMVKNVGQYSLHDGPYVP